MHGIVVSITLSEEVHQELKSELDIKNKEKNL